MTVDASAAAYVRFFETLTLESLPGLRDLCTPDVTFRDPFNDIVGIENFLAVFGEMFATIEAPRFTVAHQASTERVCYLRWTFTGRLKARKAGFEIEGMSEVHFDAAGLVTAHIDHWDAAGQVYEHFPILGGLLRLIRQRIAVRR